MSIKLLTEQNLEFLSLKGGSTGSSVSTLVKMAHCWKSHVAAHIYTVMPHNVYRVYAACHFNALNYKPRHEVN